MEFQLRYHLCSEDRKYRNAAARVGFDWDDIQDVISKVDEELAEVKESLKKNKQAEN